MIENQTAPAARRRTRRTLTALAISGMLLVPTAAVTVAAPFAGTPSVFAEAQGNGNKGQDKGDNGKGKGNGDSEGSFTECVESVNPSGNGVLNPAVITKGARCVAMVGDVNPSSLTVAEAADLVEGGLAGVEVAGFDRSEIPALLERMDESEVLQRFAGEGNLDLIDLAQDSEILALYAAGELDRGEAAELIAVAYVTRGADTGE